MLRGGRAATSETRARSPSRSPTRAHRAAQGGRGSGADVAAAVYGGVICLRAPRRRRPTCSRSPLPAAVELIVFSTGTPQLDRRPRAARVEALARRAIPTLTRGRLGADRASAATRFIAGVARRRRRGVDRLGCARERRARRRSGDAAGLPIVTPALAAAATLAEELGGAAKPSGAGGGDVGVAFLTDRGAAETFRAARAPPRARNP